MGQRKVIKRIYIHPPEADAVAAGFARVRSILLREMDCLQTIRSFLDQNWAGRAKDVFIMEPAAEKNRLSRILPRLDELISKYRRYQVEEEIEEIIFDGAS